MLTKWHPLDRPKSVESRARILSIAQSSSRGSTLRPFSASNVVTGPPRPGSLHKGSSAITFIGNLIRRFDINTTRFPTPRQNVSEEVRVSFEIPRAGFRQRTRSQWRRRRSLFATTNMIEGSGKEPVFIRFSGTNLFQGPRSCLSA
jgi:hypothetical protein